MEIRVRSANVLQFFAFTPIIHLSRYATRDEHSQVSGHFALGESAVQALRQVESDSDQLSLPINPPIQTPHHQAAPNNQPNYQQAHPQSNFDSPNNQDRTQMYPVDLGQDNQPFSQYPDNRTTNTGTQELDGISKLVAYTRNLVSNKDVLDINKAAADITDNRLFEPAANGDDQLNAASNGQKMAVELAQQNQEYEQNERFGQQPIVVLDDNERNSVFSSSESSLEVNIRPNDLPFPRTSRVHPQKNINVQILDSNNGQFLKETTSSIANDANGNYQPSSEAPSRQFLRKFKGYKLSKSVGPTATERENSQVYTTTSSTSQTTTISSFAASSSADDSTPRPVISNNFLAPIQAGLRLSNGDKHLEDCLDLGQENGAGAHKYESTNTNHRTLLEVQKSVNIKNILIDQEQNKPVQQQLVFGARFVPKQRQLQIVEKPVPYPVEVNQYIDRPVEVQTVVEKQVPVPVEIEKQVLIPYTVEKVVHQPIHYTHYVDRPVQVTKTVQQQVPVPYAVEKVVEKYIDRPYPVEKQVHVPYAVEKIVEKPVEKIVEKIVDRPVPYPVEVEKIVNRPYPVDRIVEKIVDRPVEVEKIVEKHVNVPYPVTKIVEKIVDRPVEVEKIVEKPVHVPYPVEVNKYIDRPYPVEKIVEKHVPFAVEKYIDRPVERIVEKQVEVPVDRIVEKYVDVPVHIPVEHYVDRPYPVETIVEKIVDRPVAVQVEVPVPVHIPYAVHIPVHVPYAVEKEVQVPVPYAVHYGPPKAHHHVIKTTNVDHGNHFFGHGKQTKSVKHLIVPDLSQIFGQSGQLNDFAKNYQYRPHHTANDLPSHSTILHPVHSVSTNNHVQPSSTSVVSGGGYSYPKPKPVYGVPSSSSVKHVFLNQGNGAVQNYAQNFGYQGHIYRDDYLGPPPLISHYSTYGGGGSPSVVSTGHKFHRKSLNFGKSLRWEYGFKPPMRPSIEIDEHGNPINQESW